MFIFTIFIILAIFILDLTLSILNYNYRKQPIPENVSDIYDQEEYDKWLSYTMEGFRLGIISKVFTTLILLSFLILGIFNRLADMANQFSGDKIIQTLLFLGLYGAISYILGIGFNIYRTFNKLTPLEDGELKEKTYQVAKDLGYEIKNISIMDASKRSTRLNAFFSGFGKFKSIVLYDTLVEKCTTDEIIAVLAHEIGHSLHKDTISILLYIPLSKLSRTAEFKADSVAAKAGYKDSMITALKILTKENFSNLTPHPLVVALTYSHPPTSQRIDALVNQTIF